MGPRRTQAERTSATRRALLDAARDQFAERGFSGTGREQVAAAAGVTRGALYHHFGTKEGLFRAVVEELEAGLAERVAAAALAGTDPVDELRRGCLAFLDACMEPAVRRIVLLEAPAVLGWDAWREIDARYGLALVRSGLAGALDQVGLDPAAVDPLAHLLLGALNEAALLVATAEDPVRAREDVGRTVALVLDRLLAPT
ncbi:MAG TPA: TetR/AcrR family transcriptional regulator [Acidimicrobiales bacterium]|nr:TetR/AcrR family transcriptional regulator [Acidimicrobiales bacterium]